MSWRTKDHEKGLLCISSRVSRLKKMLYDRVILQYTWTIGICDYCDIVTLEATTDLTQLLTLKAIHVYNVLFCIEYQAEKNLIIDYSSSTGVQSSCSWKLAYYAVYLI